MNENELFLIWFVLIRLNSYVILVFIVIVYKKFLCMLWINSISVMIRVSMVVRMIGLFNLFIVIVVFGFEMIKLFFCNLINVKNNLMLIVIVFFNDFGIDIDSMWVIGVKVVIVKIILEIKIVVNVFC